MDEEIQNSTENEPGWKWNAKKIKAAYMLAQDFISDAGISAELQISRNTLHLWKQAPEFDARIKEHLDEIRAEMMRQPIAKREVRVADLEIMRANTASIREDNAAEYAAMMEQQDDNGEAAKEFVRYMGGNIPKAARSGFLVRTQEVSRGKITTEWKYDAAMVREWRAILKQGEEAVGQALPTPVDVRHSGRVDSTVTRTPKRDLSKLTREELTFMRDILRKTQPEPDEDVSE